MSEVDEPPVSRDGSNFSDEISESSSGAEDEEIDLLIKKPAFVTSGSVVRFNENPVSGNGGVAAVNSSCGTVVRPQNIGTRVKSYKRRWYILFLWCAVGFMNFEIWNTWGPIQNTAKYVFGWETSEITLLVNFGLITLILFPPVFVFIINRYGLRLAQVITMFIIAAGAACRTIITDNSSLNNFFQDIGAFFNGVGGVLPMAGATMLSLKWFPESERRTATAFSAGTQQVGLAFSFLLGPLLVDDVKPISYINSSIDINNTVTAQPEQTKEHLKDQIWLYLVLQACTVGLLTVSVCIYFPSSPPKPPSEVSISQRVELAPALKSIVTNWKFWCLAFVYGLYSGIFNSYLSILDVDLQPRGFSQILSGWVGFTTTIVGACGGILISNVADRFRAYNPVKKILVALLIVGFISFLLFIIVVKTNISLSDSLTKTLIFLTIVISGICSATTVPLIFEMGSDILFPISEELISSMLVLVQNTFASLLLLVGSIPGIGNEWLDYAVLGGILLAIPLALLIDDTNERAKMAEANRRLSSRITDSDNDYEQEPSESIVLPPAATVAVAVASYDSEPLL